MILFTRSLKAGMVFKPRGPRGSCKAWDRLVSVKKVKGGYRVVSEGLSNGFSTTRTFDHDATHNVVGGL
jgi:hypothetical protein